MSKCCQRLRPHPLAPQCSGSHGAGTRGPTRPVACAKRSGMPLAECLYWHVGSPVRRRPAGASNVARAASLRRSRVSLCGSLVLHTTGRYPQRKRLPQPLLGFGSQAGLGQPGTITKVSTLRLGNRWSRGVSPCKPASRNGTTYTRHPRPQRQLSGLSSQLIDESGDAVGEGGGPCKQAAAQEA